MKRKLLAFTLGVAMVFVFFGVACGGDKGGCSSGTDSSVEKSEDISAPEEYETLLASELFPWIDTLTADNVVSVEREFGYIGVVPDTPTDLKQSSKKDDIENMLTYLKTLTVTEIPTEVGQITGGSGVELTFFTRTEEYKIYVGNGNVYVDGQYYRVSERVPQLSVEVENSENISAPEEYETLLASELFPWIDTLTVDNIVSVEREFGFFGATPGGLTYVNQSANVSDIQQILTYLTTLELTKFSVGWEGGSGTYLRVMTAEQTYELYAYNDECCVNGVWYTLNTPMPELETEETYHRFLSYSSTADLYIDGVKMKNYGDLAKEILFEKTETVTGFNYTGYELEFDGGTLVISDEKTFGFVRSSRATDTITLYTIVGETDFSQIFADYPLSA